MPSLKICIPNFWTTSRTTYSWSPFVNRESRATPTASARRPATPETSSCSGRISCRSAYPSMIQPNRMAIDQVQELCDGREQEGQQDQPAVRLQVGPRIFTGERGLRVVCRRWRSGGTVLHTSTHGRCAANVGAGRRAFGSAIVASRRSYAWFLAPRAARGM